MKNVLILFLGWGLLTAARGAAETATPAETVSSQARHRAVAAEHDARRLREHGDDPEILLRPALIADRRDRTVRFWVEASPHEFPIEYFLVGERSGRDYEALALSLARPLHLHEALEFIGLPPGRPVDYEQNRLWPRGERVVLSFLWEEEDGEGHATVRRERAERLVVDLRSGRSLPEKGFVFTGSRRLPDPAKEAPAGEPPEEPGKADGGLLYAADAFEPFSIASNYNEPMTVLDLPYRLLKGEAYEFFDAHPERRLPFPGLAEAVIEPLYPDGEPRVDDVRLEVKAVPGTSGNTPGEWHFTMKRPDGSAPRPGHAIQHVLAFFEEAVREGRDLFLTVVPDPGMPLSGVRALHLLLDALSGEQGLRIDPPPPGHLFYRAFLPRPNLRERAERVSQPWEIRWEDADGASGMLSELRWEWPPGMEAAEPELEVREWTFQSPAEARTLLDEHGPGAPWIIAFTPKEMAYGRLLEYALPLLPTHPTFYVFLAEEDDRSVTEPGNKP